MDTRFWGPSGWQLLHLIAATHPDNPEAVYDWIHLIEFILPCKYCRASFHDYMELQPLTREIVTSNRFSRWMFDIHNRVNNKLRGQGLLQKSNPSWERINRYWSKATKQLCKCSLPAQRGWDFFVSVAAATPDTDYIPAPMPDAPPASDWSKLTLAQRNRYNLLTREERITALKMWWKLIPSILPCEAWRNAWVAAFADAGEPPVEHGRAAMLRWIWKIECGVCSGLQCGRPHESLNVLHAEVDAFESSCAATIGKKRKTCRAKKRASRARIRTMRRQRHADLFSL